MYMEHYGLLGRPFQLTPDARFYFDSATHKKAMAYLGYGLSQGEGFIVITGEIGSGKTTLVEHLKLTIDRSRLTAINVVSTQVEGDDMLRSVAQQLGISTNELAKGEVLAAVEKSLHSEARQGRRVLLIVDEAQNLPFSAIEELRMLSNFQLGPEALVQIFLLGQPEFRDRLNRDPKLEQVRQRVIATHHLEPIGADEIEGYLVHRLAACGWQGNPDFTPEAVSLIHHRTGGVPRLINILAGRVMLHGAIENLTVIDGNAVRAAVADLGNTEGEIEWDPTFEAPDEAEAEFDGPEYGYDKLAVKAEAKQPIQFENADLEAASAVSAPMHTPDLAPVQEGNIFHGAAPAEYEHDERHPQPVDYPESVEPAIVESQVYSLEQEVHAPAHPHAGYSQPVQQEPDYRGPAFPKPVLVDPVQQVQQSPTESWAQNGDPASAENWMAARYLDMPSAEPTAEAHDTELPAASSAAEIRHRAVAANEHTIPQHEHRVDEPILEPHLNQMPKAANPYSQPNATVPGEPVALADEGMLDKLAILEARIEEQDAALRRVLTLLVDWAEDERKPLPDFGNLKGFAA